MREDESELSSIKKLLKKPVEDVLDRRSGPSLRPETTTEPRRKNNRTPSGIPGLDEIIQGGLIPNSTIMVCGETGSGKTIFCTQFIWNALCMGENGLYITLQQTADEIRRDVDGFGRDFNRAEELGQCRVIYIGPQDIYKIVKQILKHVKEINAKRVAIDSITMIAEDAEKRKDIRRNITYLLRELKKMGVTTVLTSEVEEGSEALSRYGIEEFLVDAVIVLKCGVDVVGGKPRSLFIKKMRRTDHDLNTHPFDITDRGIRLVKSS